MEMDIKIEWKWTKKRMDIKNRKNRNKRIRKMDINEKEEWT